MAMVVLAVLGIGVAGYLTYTHYEHVTVLCSFGHGCEEVQHSSYAELSSIPVAVLGLVGYALILGSLLAPVGEQTRLVTVALTIVGFGFSAYLTYRELFTIHAICQWCVGSAVILTLLTVLALIRFLRGEDPRARTGEDPASDREAVRDPGAPLSPGPA